MEYVSLKGCGLRVSRIAFGAMTFGGQMEEGDCLRSVDVALDAGVNFFDTANMYTKGESERILGKAMAGRRDRFILATKVGQKVNEEANGRGLSRHHILTEVENSLRRLGTDRIDVYYMHLPDYHTPVEETLSAFDALVKAGKIRYVGASNFAAWQLCRFHHVAKERLLTAPVMTQNVHNLLTRGVEQELAPFAREYGMSLIAYNPLAGGLLTDKYAEKRKPPNSRFALNSNYDKRYWNDDNLAAWDELRRLASKAETSMARLAMRWLVDSGNVDVILTGFTSIDQLRENLASLDGPPLGPEILAGCDRLWERLSGTRFKYNR